MFVADSIGSPGINFLQGELSEDRVTVAGRLLEGASAEGSGSIVLGIRPEDVILHQPGEGIIDGPSSSRNLTAASSSRSSRSTVRTACWSIREYVAASMDVHEPVSIGARVGLALRANRITLFDAESGLALNAAG